MEKLEGALLELAVSDRPVEDAEPLGALGVHRTPAEDEIERFRKPYQAREPCRAAPDGQDSEINFGEAKLKTRVIRAHPAVASECYLRPASEAHPTDGGDDRKRQPFDAVHESLARTHSLGRRIDIRHRADLAHIGARVENSVLGGIEHRAANIGAPLELIQHFAEPFHYGSRELVDLFTRKIKSNPGDRVFHGKPDRDAHG